MFNYFIHYFFISSLVQVVRILRFHRSDSGSNPDVGRLGAAIYYATE